MIAVDSSALLAIAQQEERGAFCEAVLAQADEILISAATLSEALIVADRRWLGAEMAELIRGLEWQVVPVSEADARLVAQAYARWGKGVHPAGLNWGDCFAYALAKARGCKLLYVGEDFAKTDVEGCG